MSLRALRRSAFGVLLFLLVLPLVVEGQEVSAPGEAEASERRPIDPDALKEGKAPVDLLNAPGLSRGVDAIIEEIRKREIEIALREQRIAERERAVVELEEMIVKRSTDLDRVRQEVEDRIAEWSSQGRDRVTQLADVYSAMPPEKAGRLLDKLDLDLAVSVVRKMKKKSSAAVLGAMRSDRALLVSRRMLKPLDPSSDAPAARAR